MDKALAARRVWLWLGVLSSVFAGLAIPAIVLSAIGKSYFLMAVAIALVAHGFYGIPFYFLAFARAGERLRCVRAVTEEGLRSYEAIGAYAMLTPDAVFDALAASLKREYIRGYYLGADRLLPIVSEEKPSEVVCEYCGTVLTGSATECHSCGARVSKRGK